MTENKKLEMAADLLVDALEGGSNYWYWLNEVPENPKHIPTSQRIFDAVTEEGYELKVYDVENSADDSDEGPLGTVTKQSMIDAFEIMHEQYPRHYADILNENTDADTADVWFQCVVMKEVVFG